MEHIKVTYQTMTYIKVNCEIVKHIIIKGQELNTIRHISCYVHRTLNYTGIEQVIQWTNWRF